MAKLVMVVDDYPEFLVLMQELLSRDGYQVATAHGQGWAVAQLCALRPDLLILDLALEQGESGWDILEVVRRTPDLEALPVLLCTADSFGLTARADDLHCYGNVAVLTKPFHLAEMRGMVRHLIGVADTAAMC